ncbi:MAG: MFS transporter [Micrococcales bacterium]
MIKLHRGWWVAGVTFLVLISAAAFRSTTSPMLMPLEMEFGWTRSLTSSALSLNLVFYGLTAPFAATLMQRFGVRRVVVFALTLVAAGSGLTVWMTQPWQLYLYWGVFVGFGTGCLALVFASMVANRWFHKHRSLVTGIFSAAYATGQLVFLPLITTLTDTVGWRYGALVVASFSVAIIPIFWIIYREHPRDVATFPVGATEHIKEDAKPTVTVRDNLRVLVESAKTMPFWILAGTFFVCGWTTNGLIGAHFIPAAHDHGMPTTMAAGLLALVGVFDFIGTIFSGWLTDRVNPVILLVFYYGLRGLALFTVPFVLGPTVEPPMLFFVIFYGLDWIATVPPTVELCRRYFGLTNSPVVYGWVFASHMIGAAIAAAFAGAIRDLQGDYYIAWITAAVLCLVASASVLGLKTKSIR